MPESPNDTTVSFYDLPNEARKKIYEGVLKLPHPIFLFQDGGTRVETFAPDRPPRWLALLYTSHRMHEEAAATLYGANVYTLLDTGGEGSELAQGFLSCVGSGHAKMLSHLCITFPQILRKLGSFELSADGAKIFELLRAECPKLETLEAHLAGEPAIHLTGLKRLLCIPRCGRKSVKHSFPGLYYGSGPSKIPVDVIGTPSLIFSEETAMNLVLGRRRKS